MSHLRRRTVSARGGIYALILFAAFWFTGCGQPEPTPFPTAGTGSTRSPAEDAQDPPTEEALESYESPQGLFHIQLPASWVVEERGLTPLGVQYVLGPEPLGPGPESSFLYVARDPELTPEAAAERLLCDSGCAEQIELEEATVAGWPAQRTILGESPPLEWYFVPHGDALIFFTIHDPVTLATREDLLETLELESPGTAEPTTTPTPSPIETPTPMPEVTVEAVREWRVVNVPEAGLTFEVPAQWEESGQYQWSPFQAGMLIGFGWRQTGPDAPLTDVLPAEAELTSSEPISLTWGSRISATVQAGDRQQRHLITQVGLRTYDFYSEAPTSQALDALHPTLQDIVNSIVLTERLVYHDDPVDASIEFFRELLRDPAGTAAHSYLSSELLAQLEENPDAMTLLNLPQRFHTFNLEWVTGSEQQAVLEATLTLTDDSTVVRTVHLSFDNVIGWRIDGFEEVTQPAAGEE